VLHLISLPKWVTILLHVISLFGKKWVVMDEDLENDDIGGGFDDDDGDDGDEDIVSMKGDEEGEEEEEEDEEDEEDNQPIMDGDVNNKGSFPSQKKKKVTFENVDSSSDNDDDDDEDDDDMVEDSDDEGMDASDDGEGKTTPLKNHKVCARKNNNNDGGDGMGDQKEPTPAFDGFPFISLIEFTSLMSKRISMLSQGAAPCLTPDEIERVLNELKKRQNNELLFWAEVLAVSEFILKRIPVKVTSFGRTLDPNDAHVELCFRPKRDHMLCHQFVWLWDILDFRTT
jgi:hypothetical protein